MSDNYFRSLSDSECFIPGLTQAIGSHGDIMSKGDYWIYPDNKTLCEGSTIAIKQVQALIDRIFDTSYNMSIEEKEHLLGKVKNHIEGHKNKYS